MWYLPCGFMSAMCGTRAPMRLKSSSSSSTRASFAIASRCSTALVEPPSAIVTAIAFSNASLVMIWRGPDVQLDQRHDRVARLVREVVAAAVDRRAATPTRQRHADRLADRRHRVGGEHAGARALGRARAASRSRRARSRVSVPGRARADGLEHAHDVERLVLVVTGQDRAAVEEHRRQVDAGRGHEHAGQALVAAGEA